MQIIAHAIYSYSELKTVRYIIFVDDDSNVIVERPASIQRPHKWRDIIIGVLVSITLCIMGLGGWRLYNYYYNIGVPISVTPEENIQKLAAPHKGGKPTITLSSDSILGVALNMYRLENLQAEISLVEPDTTTRVYGCTAEVPTTPAPTNIWAVW